MQTHEVFAEKIAAIGKASEVRRQREDKIIRKLRGLKTGDIRKLITMMKIMNDWILRLEEHALEHTGSLPPDQDIQNRLNGV